MSSTSPSPPEPKTFTLASRSLKLSTQEDIEPHLKPLIKTTTHTHIDLSGNTLGVPACSYLSTLLPTQTTLTSINLADIFTSRLLSEIPPALSSLLTALLQCPNLHTIDLSDNAFGLNTVGPLVTFLSQHKPLRHLILQNNGLGPAAGTQVADALTALAARKAEAKPAEGVGSLETVICGRNRLETGSMAAWARAFTANTAVRTVKMVQNGIRQDGIIELLTSGLAHCGKLQVLDLQDNTFTFTGTAALCTTLPSWPELSELGVGDCLLSARGGVLLGQKLAEGKNREVQVLRAQYNEIDARGVKAIQQAAEVGLPRLRRVEVNGNKFAEDDEGVEGLRLLLQERKDKAGEETEKDSGEEDWGLDSLSDLEEEDSDDEASPPPSPPSPSSPSQPEVKKEDEDEGQKEKERERIVVEAQQAENQPVAERKDEDVDKLAEKLGETHV